MFVPTSTQRLLQEDRTFSHHHHPIIDETNNKGGGASSFLSSLDTPVCSQENKLVSIAIIILYFQGCLVSDR